VAGVAAVGLMYVATALSGLRALPELVQQPILSAVPGPLFGLLIDALQHWAKVIEEVGLIAAMVAGLAALGVLGAWLARRWPASHPGLGAAALGWLIVTLGVLPLGGGGWLGLGEGMAAPLVWAVVFLVYGLLWEALTPPVRSGAAADLDRRRLLAALPTGLLVGGLAVVAVFRVPEWARALLAPAQPAAGGPGPLITPVGSFYQVSKNFQNPVVPVSGWSLRVEGMVDRPLTLDYERLRGLPAVSRLVTMECISNDVGGSLISTGTFTGVPLRALLEMAGARPGASQVGFRSQDGYTENLAMSEVAAQPDILVAYLLDGQPLTPDHGFPARVVVPGRYGMKSPKWLEEISLSSNPLQGFWEQQGWDPDAPIQTTARFDSPADGSLVRAGLVVLAGVAFAGDRGVRAVQWSADGRGWQAAELIPSPPSPAIWTRWRATWTPGPGEHTLAVRAVDGAGSVQGGAQASSFPSGARGYHVVRVSVGG
jgi:DMSO/TMAO reductase YedYZ molybdopterin-dependent catalytic subunit